ncbi:MAG: complement resistance protein TraT [Candidatus Omnitrophica bacterium]|nr:complement resistance protein TraT [Candidatus Omnitrophota bacterium]
MLNLKDKVINIAGMLTLIPIIFIFSGCAGTMHAIQHREMSLSAQMSDTIFLDPEILNKNRSVFVRVTNTSDFQEIDFAEILKGKLTAKGFSITNSPSSAGYVIQANLLYMGAEKEDLTADGMLAGGFGGALGGSRMGSGVHGPIAAAAGMGIVGSIVGGVVGSMIHVDTYMGAVDIQIKEASEGVVKGVMKTDAKQGSATTLQTEKEVKSNFQEYRTRIVVKATQTNINRVKACNAITVRLAMQIAGVF